MEYDDAIGQIICRRDTVTFVNSSHVAAADGNNCGVVLGAVKPWPKLRVWRVDGSTVTVDAGDVRVDDRSFMERGMVVASSTDIGGQLGTVICTTTELDLARLPSPADGNGKDDNAPPAVVARAVSPVEVRRTGSEFSVGDYVVTTAGAGTAACTWLGCVLEVCLDVDVVFDDCAKCRVALGHTDKLWTTGKTMNNDSSKKTDLYQGQRVGGSKNTVIFKKSRWLKGYWKPSLGDGTVSKVETTSVLVYWFASSSLLDNTDTDGSLATPPNQQIPRDLTFLYPRNDVLEWYNRYWSVGDQCFFCGGALASSITSVSVSDNHNPEQSSAAATACGLTTTTRKVAALRDWQQRWRQRRPRRKHRRLLDDDDLERWPLVVASTRTTVDVLWQDGTRQRGVPSTSLVVRNRETDNELFPEYPVVRRTPVTMEPSKVEEDERVGVVRGYNYKDKTVRVSWESDEEETLSVYDVIITCWPGGEGDIVVRRGDIVVRRQELPPSSTSTTTNDLSWVGQIYDQREEAQYIYVKWGDSNISKVLFSEVAVVKNPSIDDLLHALGEWVDEDGDMNNVNDEAQENNLVAHDDDDNNNNSNNGEDDGSGSESVDISGSDSDSEDDNHISMSRMNRIRVIIQALIGLAGNLFSHGWRHRPVRSELAATESNNGDLLGGNGDTKVTSTAGAGTIGGGVDGSGAETDATIGDDKPFTFPQFEIIEQCPSDHHYLDNTAQGTGGGRKWTKRVQQEWNILKNNNLPDTIYVRVFENRVDLLRVVMEGASGTPYHDGLFFFDVQLPPSYPAEPPQVYYRSFGLDVNPNLYPSGTVCLSLLNTFGGRNETEQWSPEASTILQVVVSIQGLVLNAQPYYNEPAWGKRGTAMGQRNELPYSESVFLQCLQTMLHQLRRPPVGFEVYVRDHFRRRGKHVIKACEAYRDGCCVGTLDKEGNPMEGTTERQSSAGFRIALVNVLPRLVEAFASVDA